MFKTIALTIIFIFSLITFTHAKDNSSSKKIKSTTYKIGEITYTTKEPKCATDGEAHVAAYRRLKSHIESPLADLSQQIIKNRIDKIAIVVGLDIDANCHASNSIIIQKSEFPSLDAVVTDHLPEIMGFKYEKNHNAQNGNLTHRAFEFVVYVDGAYLALYDSIKKNLHHRLSYLNNQTFKKNLYAEIFFTIDKNGNILNQSLRQSSGDDRLDQAYMNAILKMDRISVPHAAVELVAFSKSVVFGVVTDENGKIIW